MAKSKNMAFGIDLDNLYNFEDKEEKKRIPINNSVKWNILLNQGGLCAICKLNLIENKIFPPDYHHKDGNPANNDVKNIEAICPNCHRKETQKQFFEKAQDKVKHGGKGKDGKKEKPEDNPFGPPGWKPLKLGGPF